MSVTVTARFNERIDTLVSRALGRPATWVDVRRLMRFDRNFKLEYELGDVVRVPEEVDLDFTPEPPDPSIAAARVALMASKPYSAEGRNQSFYSADGSYANAQTAIEQETNFRMLAVPGNRFLQPAFGAGLIDLRSGSRPLSVVERITRAALADGESYELTDVTVTRESGELEIDVELSQTP